MPGHFQFPRDRSSASSFFAKIPAGQISNLIFNPPAALPFAFIRGSIPPGIPLRVAVLCSSRSPRLAVPLFRPKTQDPLFSSDPEPGTLNPNHSALRLRPCRAMPSLPCVAKKRFNRKRHKTHKGRTCYDVYVKLEDDAVTVYSGAPGGQTTKGTKATKKSRHVRGDAGELILECGESGAARRFGCVCS
jgi:hypothetical protein